MTQVRGLCFCPYEELNVSLFTGLGVISIFFCDSTESKFDHGTAVVFSFLSGLCSNAGISLVCVSPLPPGLLSNTNSDCLLGLILFWGSLNHLNHA